MACHSAEPAGVDRLTADSPSRRWTNAMSLQWINQKPKSGNRRRGFTLVELLTVVLVIEILMCVMLPLYVSALNDAQKKTCRSNMQTIANAVMAARVKTMASSYAGLISAGVTSANLPDLLTVPVCPNGGTYTLSTRTSSFAVVCSYAGTPTHGTFQPGVDSQ